MTSALLTSAPISDTPPPAQQLHPHVTSWGSLLRMYGNLSVKSLKVKRQEEQQITLLQSKATVNSPNYAILDKLREEMGKLQELVRDEQLLEGLSGAEGVEELELMELKGILPVNVCYIYIYCMLVYKLNASRICVSVWDISYWFSSRAMLSCWKRKDYCFFIGQTDVIVHLTILHSLLL